MLIFLVVASLAACSRFTDEPDDPNCPPVDEGGECFRPSHQGFIDHALQSTRALPQLDGLQVRATEVIEAFDAEAAQPVWIVPIRSDGIVVAASRFVPNWNEVKLGEIVLYDPPRAEFPMPGPGERLVIFHLAACGDPRPAPCLFSNFGWRIEPIP